MPDQPVCMRCLAPALAIQRQADRLVWRLYLIEQRLVIKWRHAGEGGLVCGFQLQVQAEDLSLLSNSSLPFHKRKRLMESKTFKTL